VTHETWEALARERYHRRQRARAALDGAELARRARELADAAETVRRYLDHPDVRALPFALPSGAAGRSLRVAINRLREVVEP
jgi:hypothetical protein